MLRDVIRSLLVSFTFMFVGRACLVNAAIETQNFDSESAATTAGWTGVDNRNATYGNDFGFDNSNEAGGLSGPGEAGGYFPRRSTPWGYYADTSIGNLSLDDALSASGRIVYYQETIDGGIRVGWFNNSDLNASAPAMVGMQILEANRHQAMVNLNDATVVTSGLFSGAIGPVATTFSLSWDPTERVATATVGDVTMVSPVLSEDEFEVGADLNAFGLLNGFTTTSNPPARARLFIDDLSYTSAGPTATDQTVPQLRINRFSGVTRIVGTGGTESTQLDEYIAGSNPDNPPLEDIWIPGNWNSITDQEGGSWGVIASSTDTLSEANPADSTSLVPGGQIDLGNVYDTVAAQEDISFRYGLASESFTRPGNVVFEGGLELRVNKDSGNVRIINPESVNIDIDGYVIESASGQLDDGGWESLEEQTLSGWEEIVSSSATDLSEVNFTSSTMVDGSGGLLDLGTAYGGGLAGDEDLRFTYSLAGGLTVIEGMIRYVTGDLLGDYNDNGVIDAADYTVWRDALGSTNLPNDPTPGSVTMSDYSYWVDHFGETAGAASGTAAAAVVPEPASGLIMLMATAPVFGLRIDYFRKRTRA